MVSEQICLKWNNFPLNITRNIDDMWKDESLVDVTICCEGQCIQAHKIILSAASPLFKGIFRVNPCQHPVIILQDVRFRELACIISFIYKGEINIEQQNLPALLKAAKTLQICGLSDAVHFGDNNVCVDDKVENVAKKRRMTETLANDSNEEDCSLTLEEDIIPKREPEIDEFIPSNVRANTSDEDDIKNESSACSESMQQVFPADTGGTQNGLGRELVGKMMYLQMPYANLLPSPEVLLRWSQTRTLDQLAIDLMKRLFSTEERLICNVNGKMGKPSFHTGKICLLREVLYYYSGLSPSDFEMQWKNCVTKIDTSNRGLKRNKKLKSQMIIKDIFYANNFF